MNQFSYSIQSSQGRKKPRCLRVDATVRTPPLQSCQLYMIDSGVVILSQCVVRNTSALSRTGALPLVVGHPPPESQRPESPNRPHENQSASQSARGRTSVKWLIPLTVPCLSCPRVSHHLTRLLI